MKPAMLCFNPVNAMSTYHISRSDGHWILTDGNEAEPLARFSTKPEAVLHSSQFARDTGGSLMIHGEDGMVEEERSYPVPPVQPARVLV
jgi:hypothetical protein